MPLSASKEDEMQSRSFFISPAAALLGLLVSAQPGAVGQGRGAHAGMMMPLPSTIVSQANPATPEKVALGRMLFYDARLSKDGTVSCNSCHNLEKYGVDGRQFSLGVRGQKGGRNSPTVYNAAGHVAQFWDGRAQTVEDQAKGPVLNPVEMAMPSAAAVEHTLRTIPGYHAAFEKAFPGEEQPVTFDNMARAIGAFERGLVTPGRWDRFLAGDRTAITRAEMAGHREFMHTGCFNCHNGPLIGGGSLQRLGAVKDWPSTADLGRETVTKSPTDRMVFKVPALRNVAQTAPYFHDGSVANLDEAVRRMGEYQLGQNLTPQQVRGIVLWLNTLTGDIPADYIRRPVLPD
jgi:cytochrome c peroxidase